MNEEIEKTLKSVLESIKLLTGKDPKESLFMAFANKNLLDTSDLTILFQNSKRTIQRWRDKSKLKFIKITGKCYYLWPEILPLLQSRYKFDE
jgi:hypothetical protein